MASAPDDPGPLRQQWHEFPWYWLQSVTGWLAVAAGRIRLFCCFVPIRPNVVVVIDWEVDNALARSFLAELPGELAARLRAEGECADYPAGTTMYRAGADPRAALVVRGLVRVYLSSPGGRQVTVRYARPGDVLGIAVLVGGRLIPASRRSSHLACSGSVRGR